VKQVKGVSSHFANEELFTAHDFKWQGSYGAFSVSRWDVEKIKHYIQNQKAHHAAADLMSEFEEAFEEIPTANDSSAQADDRL
jgi:putative transposase